MMPRSHVLTLAHLDTAIGPFMVARTLNPDGVLRLALENGQSRDAIAQQAATTLIWDAEQTSVVVTPVALLDALMKAHAAATALPVYHAPGVLRLHLDPQTAAYWGLTDDQRAQPAQPPTTAHDLPPADDATADVPPCPLYGRRFGGDWQRRVQAVDTTDRSGMMIKPIWWWHAMPGSPIASFLDNAPSIVSDGWAARRWAAC